jgi:DNA-nicking Smr family endonuclease
MNEFDDDTDLFRSAVGPVRRVRSERDHSRPAPPPPRPSQRERDEARVMDDLAHAPIDFATVETGEEISYLRPGLQNRVLTRLKRGHWRVEDELDLHQMNLEAASASIRSFLSEADRDRVSCVRIIHGKGLRSGPEGPQLKRLTARLLSRHDRVAAFTSTPPHDGGTGAVYVLLRARR